MEPNEYLETLPLSEYGIDDALVLGPYPTSDFLKKFAGSFESEWMPKTRLTFIADDGWAQTQLDEIRNHYESEPRKAHRTGVTIRRIVCANRSGLVHAKLIFLTLKKRIGTYTKRVLLLGSANASRQGFGIHAETFVNIDLARETLNNSLRVRGCSMKSMTCDRSPPKTRINQRFPSLLINDRTRTDAASQGHN